MNCRIYRRQKKRSPTTPMGCYLLRSTDGCAGAGDVRPPSVSIWVKDSAHSRDLQFLWDQYLYTGSLRRV
jgi:hypothetical protein